MNLDIDTSVRYADGAEAGHISRIVILPEQGTVESVVLTTPGVMAREVVVPVSMLSMAPGDVVQFNGDSDALNALPDFAAEEYVPPPEGEPVSDAYVPGRVFFPLDSMTPMLPVVAFENVPEGSIVLSQGTAVVTQDGARVGIVDEVLIGDAGALLGIIVRPDDESVPDFRVPLDLIATAADDTVLLTCTLADLPQHVEALIEENEEPEPQPLL